MAVKAPPGWTPDFAFETGQGFYKISGRVTKFVYSMNDNWFCVVRTPFGPFKTAEEAFAYAELA